MISRNERRKNPRPLQNFRLIPSDSTIALFGILFTAAYRKQTMSRKALESRDVSVETVAGPEEPEIRQTSPPRTREDYEKYSPLASAAIRIS